MVAIAIFGMRGNEDAVRQFRQNLPCIIARTKDLDLAMSDIDVYIIPEYAPPDRANITVQIHGLLAETSLDVQHALAKTVLGAIRAFHLMKEHLEHYGIPERIRVFVNAFDPEEQGYASSTMRRTRLELVSQKPS